MRLKSILVFAGLLVATASSAFLLGARVTRLSLAEAEQPAASSAVEKMRPPVMRIEAEEPEFSRVTIENLDRLAFDQAYELVRSAPREALAQWARRLEELPTGPRKSSAIAAFYKTLAQVDAAAGVDLVLQTVRREARSEAQSALCAAVPPSELSQIGRLVIGLNLENGGLFSLLADWSQYDPASASAFADLHAEKTESDSIGALVNNWAQIDPAAAKAWFDHLDPARKPAHTYDSFYQGWLTSDRTAAVQDLIANAANKKLLAPIQYAGLILARASEAEAKRFVLSLPDSESKRAAVKGIAGFYSTESDSGAAVQFPAPALARWLLELPEEISGDQIGVAAANWSEQDPSGLQEWVEQLPVHSRDRVLAQFCQTYVRQDPQSRIEAAFRIEDEALRERSLRSAMQSIGSPGDARELLQGVQLSPRQIAQLEHLASEL